MAAGAEPVDLLPGTKTLPDLDGLLLPGGWDVDPSFYGERRDEKIGETDPELDETELSLFRQARERALPVLGICRGQQVINVAMGGSLVQHLEGHEVRSLGRSHLAHTIEVNPSSELGRAAGEHKIRVNSLHHQAIKDLADGLQQTASGEDGTVEGVRIRRGRHSRRRRVERRAYRCCAVSSGGAHHRLALGAGALRALCCAGSGPRQENPTVTAC